MIFLDTCVWIELCCVTAPKSPSQVQRAQAASNILAVAQQEHEEIITCAEQLLEVISAIQKIKMRTYNQGCANTSNSKVGNLKEYRSTADFKITQQLCEQTIEDIYMLASSQDIGTYDFDDILQNLHLVDINDCLYYRYCINHQIKFYTFDHDFAKLETASLIHII